MAIKIKSDGIVIIVIDVLMASHYLAKLVAISQGICFENLPFGATIKIAPKYYFTTVNFPFWTTARVAPTI